jgi:hypothetical protein
MPDLKGLNSPFDGYAVTEDHGRGKSSAKVTAPINKDLPGATATPSRAEEIELFVTKQGFDRAKVEEN